MSGHQFLPPYMTLNILTETRYQYTTQAQRLHPRLCYIQFHNVTTYMFVVLKSCKVECTVLIFLVQYDFGPWSRLLYTPSLTPIRVQAHDSRSWQYISYHWDTCSNHSAISDFSWYSKHIIRYPSQLGGQRQHRMRRLPDTSTVS